MRFKKYLNEQQMRKEFGNDPLYMAVLNAKSKQEYQKALDTLQSIRGPNAVRLLQKAAKKMNESQVTKDVKAAIADVWGGPKGKLSQYSETGAEAANTYWDKKKLAINLSGWDKKMMAQLRKNLKARGIGFTAEKVGAISFYKIDEKVKLGDDPISKEIKKNKKLMDKLKELDKQVGQAKVILGEAKFTGDKVRFIASLLHNDEASTDADLVLHIAQQTGISIANISRLVKKERTKFLSKMIPDKEAYKIITHYLRKIR